MKVDKMLWTVDESLGKGDFGGWKLAADLKQRVVTVGDLSKEVLLSFHAIQGESLPNFAEVYVRSNRLIAHYPQEDGDLFGVDLDLTLLQDFPVPCLQLDVAVQTTFLDCHPMLEMRVRGEKHEPCSIGELAGEETALPASMLVMETANLAPPVLSFRAFGRSMAVMLPPRDWPVTGFRNVSGFCSYRLFEEFLEKGVIRKSRIWIVSSQPADAEPLTEATMQSLYRQLCGIPLPLTA